MFNYQWDQAGACYLIVYPGGTVMISSDTGYTYGSGWQASGVLTTSGTIANSQCSLDLASSTVKGSGNSLTATLNLTFKAGLPGPQTIFMYSGDNQGLTTPPGPNNQTGQPMGTWTTSTVSSQPPSFVSLTPTAGTGMRQTFSYTASSVNGAAYLTQISGLFNTGIDGANACWIYYDRAANTIALINDTQNAWLSAPIRSPGTLSNSQCTVDSGETTAIANGNNLTLDVVITFNSSWTGSKNNYVQITDRSNTMLGWTPEGTWTVGSPAITTDPRRTGIYSTGSYWGGGGEQVDTLSGNLNFSIPLLTATGRTGWTVPLGLTYNSQNWRQDDGANLPLGADVGYGFGWQMQIGSITPYTAVTQNGTLIQTVIDHYVFTDGTGAQYRLDINNNGVWSSKQGIYAWFDSSANKLHFPDGSFWVMGCTSSSGEADSGTMYPTTIEDVNGNQILIVYKAGAGIPVSTSNTSARISTIQDARVSNMGPTYVFTYNSDAPVQHLTLVNNYIGTNEKFAFTYVTAALMPPFGNDSIWTGLTTTHLQTLSPGITALVVPYQFTYDTAGGAELTQVRFPYGGHLRWAYATDTYLGNRSLRAVSARYLAADSAGATEWTYGITRDNASSSPVHSFMTLTDLGGGGAKTWNFNTSGSQIGLVANFQQQPTIGGSTGIRHDYYTWTPNASGTPYISSKTSVLDEGMASQQTAQTTQVQDQYGNVTQSVIYPYNQTAALKTYNSTYLNTSTYTANYILNRMLTTTLTFPSGNTQLTKTLVNNYYDGRQGAGQPYPSCGVGGWAAYTTYGYVGPTQGLDANPPVAFANRALISGTVTPAKTTCPYYYPYGGLAGGSASDGSTISLSADASTNYAAPQSVVTQSYSETISYNAWLAITQTVGANGEQLSIQYDPATGRPVSGTSAYGAVTSYNYSASGVLPASQIEIGPNGLTRTTLDGLGRAIRVERGPTSGYTSVVDTVYGPCGCSPLGKIQKVSAPYPSGQSAANWTIYAYDGIGRTLTTVLPDGASTTTYVYSGNQTTVTDPAGKWKTFTTDVLGNLMSVTEPVPTGN